MVRVECVLSEMCHVSLHQRALTVTGNGRTVEGSLQEWLSMSGVHDVLHSTSFRSWAQQKSLYLKPMHKGATVVM